VVIEAITANNVITNEELIAAVKGAVSQIRLQGQPRSLVPFAGSQGFAYGNAHRHSGSATTQISFADAGLLSESAV